jgi:hypothetical protein
MSQSDDLPTFPTLGGCFRPVEEYLRLVESATVGPPPARVELTALDAYLMHQVAAYLPSPPTVVDFAGAATGGASTVFWWSDDAITSVIPADDDSFGRAPGPSYDGDDWKRLVAAGGERLGLRQDAIRPADWMTADLATPERIAKEVPPLRPVLFSVAVPEEGAGRLGALIDWAFTAFGNPVVLAWPAGRFGASAVLDQCLSVCRDGDRSLALPRETSPFLAASRLAVVCRSVDRRVTTILDRIGSAFEGNFRFLDLLRDSVQSAAKIATLEKRVAEASASRKARPRVDYPALVRRVQQAAAAALPTRCVVAVVNKGDDNLLHLGDRTGWHFPQMPDGTYAGHYPADSEAAISHLEEVRDAGADYLLLPATALWWLDHYADLKDYLALKYTELYRGDDTGVIFALSPAAKARAIEHRCLALADEIRSLRGEAHGSLLDGPGRRPGDSPAAALSPSANGVELRPTSDRAH